MFERLCSPAKLYLGISVVMVIFMLFQNLRSRSHKICLGDYNSCYDRTGANIFIFIFVKMMYVAFWTYVLNWACRSGNSTVSWIMAFFPIVLFVVLFTFTFFIFPWGGAAFPYPV